MAYVEALKLSLGSGQSRWAQGSNQITGKTAFPHLDRANPLRCIPMLMPISLQSTNFVSEYFAIMLLSCPCIRFLLVVPPTQITQEVCIGILGF